MERDERGRRSRWLSARLSSRCELELTPPTGMRAHSRGGHRGKRSVTRRRSRYHSARPGPRVASVETPTVEGLQARHLFWGPLASIACFLTSAMSLPSRIFEPPYPLHVLTRCRRLFHYPHRWNTQTCSRLSEMIRSWRIFVPVFGSAGLKPGK